MIVKDTLENRLH